MVFLRYPDDQDKDMLAARSGLTRNQVRAAWPGEESISELKTSIPDLEWFLVSGVELVHQRPRSDLEADDRGDVQGPEEERGWRAGDGNGDAADHEQSNMLSA
jgi:hypothetical protein